MHTKHGQEGRCRRPCSSSAGSAGGGGAAAAAAVARRLAHLLPADGTAPCRTAGWMSSEAHPAGDSGAEQQPTLDQSMPHTAGEAPPEPVAAAVPGASEPAGSDEHPPSTSKVRAAAQIFPPSA